MGGWNIEQRDRFGRLLDEIDKFGFYQPETVLNIFERLQRKEPQLATSVALALAEAAGTSTVLVGSLEQLLTQALTTFKGNGSKEVFGLLRFANGYGVEIWSPNDLGVVRQVLDTTRHVESFHLQHMRFSVTEQRTRAYMELEIIGVEFIHYQAKCKEGVLPPVSIQEEIVDFLIRLYQSCSSIAGRHKEAAKDPVLQKIEAAIITFIQEYEEKLVLRFWRYNVDDVVGEVLTRGLLARYGRRSVVESFLEHQDCQAAYKSLQPIE